MATEKNYFLYSHYSYIFTTFSNIFCMVVNFTWIFTAGINFGTVTLFTCFKHKSGVLVGDIQALLCASTSCRTKLWSVRLSHYNTTTAVRHCRVGGVVPPLHHHHHHQSPHLVDKGGEAHHCIRCGDGWCGDYLSHCQVVASMLCHHPAARRTVVYWRFSDTRARGQGGRWNVALHTG